MPVLTEEAPTIDLGHKDATVPLHGHESTDLATLRSQCRQHHPELLPLLDGNTDSVQQLTMDGSFELTQKESNAIHLSSILQERLLEMPAQHLVSPCCSARSMVLLYTKLKYLATFAKKHVDAYAAEGPSAAEEVRYMRLVQNAATEDDVIQLLADGMKVSTSSNEWEEIATFVRDALPFAEQTESLLVRGSDDRSILCPTCKTNKYHTSTIPRCSGVPSVKPEDLESTDEPQDIRRASCTCSGVNMEAFERCEALRQELLLSALSTHPNAASPTAIFDRKMDDVRTRLSTCLGLTSATQQDKARVVLTPSGSDAELIATSSALCRLHALKQSDHGKVVNLVMAHGEIGSGSSDAAGGKSFNKLTPSGQQVTPGEPLQGYPTDLVEVINFGSRDENGEIACTDEQVAATVREKLDNTSNVVLLHLVVGTKTGFSSPKVSTVESLASEFGDRLLIVVDACQVRLDQYVFAEFVNRGFITMVTGSKYFGGAPFCGSVILPSKCIEDMEQQASGVNRNVCFPSGLHDFFSKYELPTTMNSTRACLSTNMNVGLLLRWESALINMEPYFRIAPTTVDAIIDRYMTQCKSMMQSRYGNLVQVLENPKPSSDEWLRPKDTIVSFKVRKNESTFFTVPELRKLHKLLSQDLSATFPSHSISSRRCLIGQPVALGGLHDGVLRIALSAEMVNGVAGGHETDAMFEKFAHDDGLILQKISLLTQHWTELTQDTMSSSPSVPTNTDANNVHNFSVKKDGISKAVRRMKESGVIGSGAQDETTGANALSRDDPVKIAVVFDQDAIDNGFKSLHTAFPSHFQHRFAMKACPLSFFVKQAIAAGAGFEGASLIEVQQALRQGCAPEKVVFDSPAKTRAELAFGLNAGVEINIDNLEELETVVQLVSQMDKQPPRIGLRINPLLGSGSNEYLSVSTVYSKFGVPLTDVNRAKIKDLFQQHKWLTGIHCHVGSQGYTLETLASGARIISELADEIDAHVGEARIQTVNIGGGLPANYDSDDVTPTYAEYVEVLRRCAPKLFENTHRTVLTEYGRSLCCKTCWTVSEIEYVKTHDDVPGFTSTDDDALRQTAIIHAGSDLFLRTCYKPELFPHRMSVYSSDGTPSTAPEVFHNVAGPLCFGGDLVGRKVRLPTANRGDFIVIHDTGANTVALFSRHCSRPLPAIYGYRHQGDDVVVQLLKPAETSEEVMRFWG